MYRSVYSSVYSRGRLVVVALRQRITTEIREKLGPGWAGLTGRKMRLRALTDGECGPSRPARPLAAVTTDMEIKPGRIGMAGAGAHSYTG